MNPGDFISRDDAGAELARILQARETEYQRLIDAQRLSPAEAERRNARLAAAWSYVLCPELVLVGPWHYRTALELAAWLAEARGYVLSPKPKGARR